MVCSAFLMLSACASKFPTPENAAYVQTDNALSGNEIFLHSFNAHGGASLDKLHNLNVSLSGKWKQLIRRIQPMVTDFRYRVDSQERILPTAGVYAAEYTGPAGIKSVFRTPNTISVRYNNEQSNTPEVLSSTALTADSFHLFLLGPLALTPWQSQVTRLSNKIMNGISHWRIHLERTPGLGLSKRDQVVLWINPKSKLTARVQITLTGHETTKKAHVETDYLAYIQVKGFTFPTKFFERVNAPIAIDAHAWSLTGLDINRDYELEDIATGYKNSARLPADTSLFK
jgi:hypothetical protein